MSFSSYYQAVLEKERTWFFVGALRSFEYMAFERTVDKATGTFEFFVSPDFESTFVEFMNYFKELGIVHHYSKLPNRLLDPQEQV